MKKLKSTKQKYSSKSKPKQVWPFIIGIIAILFSLKLIYSSFTNVSFDPGTSINQVGVATGKVTLTLSPASITIQPGAEQVFTLSIDAGSDYVTLAQLELTYDQAKIGTPIVTQGDFLTNTLGATQVGNGKITLSYASGIPAEGQKAGKTGTGTLATIKITPPVAGTSALAFGDSSLVLAIDGSTEAAINTNMLKSANNVTIQVGTVVDTASPSPSTATTTSPSPTTIASTTPILSPSPSPTLAPTKPSKPSNLLYNCYDNGQKVTLRWDPVSGVTSYEVYLDHKDGDRDIRETVGGREKDLSITANTKYNWSLASIKDGLKSDVATVNDLNCSGTSTSNTSNTTSNNSVKIESPTPTPAPTKKPSIISSIKKAITPSKSATPKPSPSPTLKPTDKTELINLSTPTPTPGSLADIYKNIPSPTPVAQVEKPGVISQIFLGWKAIFLRIISSFTN